MFHEGTLQSGISRAIQEQKLVACFVCDDGDESSTWENEWLKSGWISQLLEQKAVMLRLEAGSTEAGFLAAFCPLSKTPTYVVIENGQLRDQIDSGVTENEFINRVRAVLGASPLPGAAQRSTSTPAADSPEPEATLEASSPEPIPTPPEERRPISPILPPSKKAKGKQKVTPPNANPNPAAITPAQASAREALRKKKQEEKDELARIKARIEADKAERKAQAEARKAEREGQAPSSTSTFFPTRTSNRGSQAKSVHLNVRLFDGKTIRSTFSRDAKLQDEVRSWVDQQFIALVDGSDARHPPYYFRQILAPLPSRELSAGEESETLGDIDLAPSATLVLIPVKGYTDAYSGGGSGGLVGGVVGTVTGLVGGVFGLASSAAGLVGSTLGSVVGIGGPATPANQGDRPASEGRTVGEGRVGDTPNVRVRTLADQRAREPNEQFYNGNQLNFEPNDDDSSRR
ncbi:hypothetical protein P154DRAFT_526068 [Amniculicola lignicola CBS 123094]|uniref:UBX domain-containing protein 2 n=1 Tax=Amniculicola lignicola CBS 123094 TaxID=1392246 RepID=A0A6A5W9L4_9PLEO|nr:hypothetical protein P154DRAFT_526068 [Amniculicola lignicola CBS 123094]